MGFLRVTPIDPGQQIAQLRRRNRYRFTGNRWPDELSSLESFCEQAGSLAIVPDRLHKVAAATAEDEQMTAERVFVQHLLHLECQRRKASAHICVACREPHSHIPRYSNHRRPSTSRTRARASGSTCASTRMHRRLPRSISINPVRAAATERTRPSTVGKSFGVSSADAATAAICTGVKDGATCSDVRACRRQVNTRLAATPLRRATSVTFAPGANVSSTIRALSSCDQRRRRSSPPKTSTRIA
ncbi:hypothetical protein ABIE91_001108 [Bradyrhizobium elkanii]